MKHKSLVMLTCTAFVLGCDDATAPSVVDGDNAPPELAATHADVAPTPHVEGDGWAPEPERSENAKWCITLSSEQSFAQAVKACTLASQEGSDPEIDVLLAEAEEFASLSE